jgi:glycosyltransferase involved in cell wall biosynthesis
MDNDIMPFNSNVNNDFLKSTTAFLSLNKYVNFQAKNILPEILFITSYPPRECGIATYSQDLINAINNQFENTFRCAVCALESEHEQHIYNQSAQYILNTDNRNSFIKTAFQINKNENIKLVVMQHEFGFFEKKEKEFKDLFNCITKPIVFVFHTVLSNANATIKNKVLDMAAIASSIVVMTNDAANILINEYEIAAYKITVIPHGTHLVSTLNREKVKEKFQLTDRMVLSTFGLLSSSKSIETTLDALPEVIKIFPKTLFLILGKTHPTIVKNEGEKYRNMLEEKVKTLGIENNVRFINEYLQLPTLLEYLQLTDIYLFTSKDPNQAVSGTFSYAVGCGCPVISTPIPHAKEVLGTDNGIIIDFENSEQLSKAIISLIKNEKLRAKISIKSFQKMAATAWQNSAIAHTLLFKKLVSNCFQINYRIPKINLSHIKKMTTHFGMIQFSKIANPDKSSGYTLDDNARALIAICQHYELYHNENDLILIHKYLQFIKYCLQVNNCFLNYVNAEKQFTNQNNAENLEDSTGRAIWALGFVVYLKEILPINLSIEAEHLMQRTLPHLVKIHSTRAMAFMIKGLHYQNNEENLHLLKTFANRIMQMYKHEKTNQWQWFESYLTYGNSLLPEAMLCAYLSTENEEYKTIAKESFEFLLSIVMNEDKIKVVSNKTWMQKNILVENTVGGEQPIDVAYTIMALEKFYAVFEKDIYKQKAITAFSWFLGNNHLNQIVYNPCTGGCYDGVEEHNVNLNQGAESTVSYLMARLAMERMLAEETESVAKINLELVELI